MAEQIQFELVSPEALLMSRPVDMVVVPGVEGDFGALPQHAPFISTLRPGVISVFEGNQVTDRVFVAGGFAEVTAERCTVLAERALPLRDLNRELETPLEASDAVGTVAGLCIELAGGAVPQRGARLAGNDGIVLVIAQATPRAVRQVRVIQPPPRVPVEDEVDRAPQEPAGQA